MVFVILVVDKFFSIYYVYEVNGLVYIVCCFNIICCEFLFIYIEGMKDWGIKIILLEVLFYFEI